MRQFMAALAALLVALPAAAQTQVVPYNGTSGVFVTGTVTTSGDIVALAISGAQWSAVDLQVTVTGTALVTTEISTDYGANWILSAYAKNVTSPSANPSVLSLNGIALGSAVTWEIPLPSNATNFRARCAGTGTTTSMQLYGAGPYVSTVPVIAVLYDKSVTAGAANNTGTLDTTGWREVVTSIVVGTAVTGAASLNIVDDAGAAIAIGTSASIAIGTFTFGWGDSGTFGTTNPFTMVGGVTALPLDRRFNIAVAGATTSATRIRVVARR